MMIAAETEMFKLSVKPNIGILENHRRVANHLSTINISLQTNNNTITQPNPLFDIFIKHFAMKKIVIYVGFISVPCWPTTDT
jgi:hypothetical protein